MMVPNFDFDGLSGTAALVTDVGIDPTVASTDIDKLDVMLPPTLAANADDLVVGATVGAAFFRAASTDMLGAEDGYTGDAVAAVNVQINGTHRERTEEDDAHVEKEVTLE